MRTAEIGHLGVDPLDPVVADHADAVVAVEDEVGVADLVQAHRRQLFAAVSGRIREAGVATEERGGGLR
jgi:hypothetical protein